MENDFLSNLKKHRKAKGFTQQELADLIGVSRQTINNYESGVKTPPWNKIQKLSELLHIDKTVPSCFSCYHWQVCSFYRSYDQLTTFHQGWFKYDESNKVFDAIANACLEYKEKELEEDEDDTIDNR